MVHRLNIFQTFPTSIYGAYYAHVYLYEWVKLCKCDFIRMMIDFPH